MEEKIIKASVYTTDVFFNETAELPIDAELTLPDFCPDISRIFKCRGVPRIASKGISGKTVTVDGTVGLTLLYCNAEGRLCSYEYQYPFSKKLETGGDCADGKLSVTAKCEYITCRAVTGRKLDIHGAVTLNVRVFKNKATEIISDIDDPDTEQKRAVIPAAVPIGYSEKYLTVEEEISIGQGQPSVEHLLRYDAKPCITENKIINGKIVVKGEMPVWILYSPYGSDEPQSVKSVLPFSQIIDMEGITDVCECETKSDIAFLEIKPKHSDGEIKGFMITVKLLLTSKAICLSELSVVTDAFSRKYSADIKSKTVGFEQITDSIKETYHCKKSIQLDGPIQSVCDLWCDMKSVSTKFESGSAVICGTIAVCIISVGEDGGNYCEKTVDFEYKYPVREAPDSLKCEPEAEIASSGYTITAPDTLELRIDLGINAAVYLCTEIPLITDISIDTSSSLRNIDESAMTICYAGENECVWDIAKRYNAGVEEIISINSLDGEELSEGKMLLIPTV